MDASDVVMDGPLAVAGALAIAAGLVSFLSPCCLPLVPGYLSYVTGMTGAESRQSAPGSGGDGPASAAGGSGRVVVGAVLFVLGFAVVFTSYGALFGALGSLLISHQETVVRVLGVATIVFGLMFSGLLWRIPMFGRSARLGYSPRAGLAGAPVLGAMFGLGWTPCIGPTLAAVLTLATSNADAGRGALLSFAYSVGLGIPFVLAAFSVSRAMRRLQWARRHASRIMMVGGVAMVCLGLLQVTGLWLELMTRLQGVVANWQTPI